MSGDGKIIDENGNENTLHNLMGGKITLLSFIYSNCTDTNGCPLATSVFYKIQEKIKKDNKILSKLKMISLSFDPTYDSFKNFISSQMFVNKVGDIAEKEGHHPDISFGWGYAEVKIFTHKINGLAAASIGKVSTVATGSIGKINTVD